MCPGGGCGDVKLAEGNRGQIITENVCLDFKTERTWYSLTLVTLSPLSCLSSLDSCSSSSGIAGDADEANLRNPNAFRILVWIFRNMAVSGLGSLSSVEDPDDSPLEGAMPVARR